MTKLKSIFLQRYEEKSAIMRKRSSLLFTMNAIILAVVVLVPPLVLLIRGDITRPLVISLPAIIGMAVSLAFLRRGAYNTAANISSLATSLAIVVGVIYQVTESPAIGYSSMIYIIPAGIVFGALFCSRLWTSLLFAFFIAGNAAFFLWAGSISPVDAAVLKTGFIDSMLAIVFTYALSMLIIRTNREAMEEVKLESEKNYKQFAMIRDMMGSASEVSGILVGSSGKMAAMASSLSNSSHGQAAALEEISSAVEQVNASADVMVKSMEDQYRSLDALIREIAALSNSVGVLNEKVEETTRMSVETQRDSTEGESVLAVMNGAMSAISDSSKQMSMIADVISRISDQIRLLSLNAAIEAARAGSAGRGFAVVADEISKLSDQTGDSLKEIYQHIRSTGTEVSRGLESMNATVEITGKIMRNIGVINGRINDINLIVREHGQTSRAVNDNAQLVRSRYDEINLAAHEQMTALNEISKSIIDISELTQTTASSISDLEEISGEVARASGTLSSKIGNGAS
jgi:methyl-accepting chemotaxis protein